MTIKEVKRRYNPEIKCRERYLDDREFHSLQEIKDYCRSDTMYNRKPTPDEVVYTFMLMDTQEEIDISAQWCEDNDGFYYVKLDYLF